MPNSTELVVQISAALEYAAEADEDELRAYTTWQLKGFMEVVCLSHMTTSEQVALSAVLTPVFARVLSGRGPKPKRPLRLVG